MSFDWTTLILQLVNVVVLLAILRHFLFRPVADIIARRQAETDAALRAAEDAGAAAQQAAAQAQAEARATVAARHDLLVSAQADAAAERDALLAAAHEQAAGILAEGRAARDRDAARWEDRALARARDLAGVIAERALAAQPQGAQGYAGRLASALAKLDPLEREAVLSGANLRLVAPLALTDADRRAVRAALGPYDIAPPEEIDPSLIAGLDLRSDAGAVRNSLAHDLDRIARAMRDDRAA